MITGLCPFIYASPTCGYYENCGPQSTWALPICSHAFDGDNGCYEHGVQEVIDGKPKLHPSRFGGFPDMTQLMPSTLVQPRYKENFMNTHIVDAKVPSTVTVHMLINLSEKAQRIAIANGDSAIKIQVKDIELPRNSPLLDGCIILTNGEVAAAEPKQESEQFLYVSGLIEALPVWAHEVLSSSKFIVGYVMSTTDDVSPEGLLAIIHRRIASQAKVLTSTTLSTEHLSAIPTIFPVPLDEHT